MISRWFPPPLGGLDSAVDVNERIPEDGLRRERYGAGLVALTITFAIQGIATPSEWEEVLTSVLLGLVLLLALWEARASRRIMLPASVIVGGSIFAGIGAAATGTLNDAASRLPDALVVALTLPAIAIGALRGLRRGRQITVQTVFAVLSLYILIGMFFGNLYISINSLGGSPFFAGGQSANVPNCMYYSFATLTTVGYGDLTARTSLGHTLSAIEAVFGTLFLVTVVSQIVTNIGRRRPVAGKAHE